MSRGIESSNCETGATASHGRHVAAGLRENTGTFREVADV
jgi:hypothetical protein